MTDRKDAAMRVKGFEVGGIEGVLRDSRRYAEELRERDRMDARRAWLWFGLLVLAVGTVVGLWAWIGR